MKKHRLLLLDALINFILGIVLIIFSSNIVHALGIPGSSTGFYPNILGAVFVGIAIALALEYYRNPDGAVGLGLGGAIAINLCAGAMLLLWLIFGNLAIPLQGVFILWFLAVIAVVISAAELIVHYKK